MIYGVLGMGLLLLLLGSVAILRGGAGLVRVLRLPRIVFSLFVASLAMSAPELSIAVQANIRGLPDIALGDILGSCIANLLLVFGIGALIAPMPAPPRTVFRDAVALIIASLVFLVLLFGGFAVPIAGAVLIALWVIYLVIAYVTELGRPQQTFATDLPLSIKTYSASASLFLIVIGVGCLFFGAFFAVDFSVLAARMLHVGQVAIALTVVAIGTALPELGATMASARRGHAYAASSQLLASSIFNLLLVFGIAICARPMSVAPELAKIYAPVLAGCAIMVGVFMLSGWRLTRVHGVILLGLYFGYIAAIAVRSGAFLHG
jgi:cation:H+ antiporter